MGQAVREVHDKIENKLEAGLYPFPNSFCFCRSSCAPVSFVSSCLTTFQVPSGTRTMPIRFSFPLGVECPHMGAFRTRSSKAERCCCVCMPGQAPANALSRSFGVIDSCTNFWALSQSRILFSLFDTLLGFVRQQLDAFLFVFFFGVEWQHTHRSDSDRSTRPLFPEFLCFFKEFLGDMPFSCCPV